MKSGSRIACRIPIAVTMLLAQLLVPVGCTVGPDYKRPVVDAPGAFRRAASDTNGPDASASFADVGWWHVFKDPQLSAYIIEALTNSWDIKIAAAAPSDGAYEQEKDRKCYGDCVFVAAEDEREQPV